MDSSPLPPPPSENFLQWALTRPHEVEAYLRRIVALSRLEIVVRSANGTTRVPVEFSRENALATLPPISSGSEGSGDGDGGGDVFGPTTATPNNLAAFVDGTGKLIKDAGASVEDLDPRGLHSLWIPAAVMAPSAVDGCDPLTTHAIEGIVDGGDAADEFTDVIDGGTAADEFTDILDGNPI